MFRSKVPAAAPCPPGPPGEGRAPGQPYVVEAGAGGIGVVERHGMRTAALEPGGNGTKPC